jgi:hypothetical protein
MSNHLKHLSAPVLFFRIENINANPLTDVGGIKKGKTFIMDKRIFFF